jgi:hypothetical protein
VNRNRFPPHFIDVLSFSIGGFCPKEYSEWPISILPCYFNGLTKRQRKDLYSNSHKYVPFMAVFLIMVQNGTCFLEPLQASKPGSLNCNSARVPCPDFSRSVGIYVYCGDVAGWAYGLGEGGNEGLERDREAKKGLGRTAETFCLLQSLRTKNRSWPPLSSISKSGPSHVGYTYARC